MRSQSHGSLRPECLHLNIWRLSFYSWHATVGPKMLVCCPLLVPICTYFINRKQLKVESWNVALFLVHNIQTPKAWKSAKSDLGNVMCIWVRYLLAWHICRKIVSQLTPPTFPAVWSFWSFGFILTAHLTKIVTTLLCFYLAWGLNLTHDQYISQAVTHCLLLKSMCKALETIQSCLNHLSGEKSGHFKLCHRHKSTTITKNTLL